MSIQMPLQGFGTFEAPWAKMTLVSQGAVVSSNVELHLAWISESLAADVTDEWRFTRVDTNMNVTATLLHILAGAVWTNKRSINFVPFFVDDQIIFTHTFPLTHITHK